VREASEPGYPAAHAAAEADRARRMQHLQTFEATLPEGSRLFPVTKGSWAISSSKSSPASTSPNTVLLPSSSAQGESMMSNSGPALNFR
jgi:hypothetical protein